jgi:aminopeptidase N
MSTADPHSFARPDEARVVHVDVDLEVDFEARRLSGRVALDLEVAPGAARLLLDTRDLEIERVTSGDGAPLAHRLGPRDPILGAPLAVEIGQARRVIIHYRTGEDASALDWLAPSQTAGGEHPFLFTQGHAIETRSYLPLQDSPRVRITYDARIVVPDGLVAVMSAARVHPKSEAPAGKRAFAFEMREPIPPYLVALAVGDIGFRAIGPRTGVFAEPSMLDRAAWELGELEDIVAAAEALLGPYRWGRFDVLVMPPSFPYGGMENPRLTFASPSLLAGDRSLVTVIAHELAHAWAGNLVTNATWNDFWINEGTTVYLELRLNEALWGTERATLLRVFGARELDAEVRRQGPTAPDTRLRYDMRGRNPAEGVTVIPYLKGAAFFWALEAEVGRPRLDAWLRGWFERRAFTSVTTDDLLADLREHLLGASGGSIDDALWIDAPGAPSAEDLPTSTLLLAIEDAVRRFVANEPIASLGVVGLAPQATRHFLTALAETSPSSARLAELDAHVGYSESRNAEVLFAWLRLAARSKHDPALPVIEAFLLSQGRGKFLRPLYAALLESPWGEATARRTYAAARPRYHAVVRRALDALFEAPRTA